MANYNKKNYREEKKNGILRAIGALALTAVMLAGGCAVGYGAATHWTYKRGNIQAEQPSSPDDGNGGAIITPGENDKFQMNVKKIERAEFEEYGISPQAETAYRITATITPDNVSSTRVNWSVAWENSSGAWSSGKTVTDYVTVTPTSEGSLVANVECKQAFGEKVNVTVRTTDETNLSATCVCNYVKRVSKVDIKVPKSSMSDDRGFNTATDSQPYYVKLYPAIGSTGAGSITTAVTYGIGTVQEEVSVTVSYYLTDNFYSILKIKGYDISASQRFNSGSVTVFNNSTSGCLSMFGSNFSSNVSYANAVISSLSTAGPNGLKFKVTASGAHNNYSAEYGAMVDTSAMRVKATNIEMDKTNLDL